MACTAETTDTAVLIQAMAWSHPAILDFLSQANTISRCIAWLLERVLKAVKSIISKYAHSAS